MPTIGDFKEILEPTDQSEKKKIQTIQLDLNNYVM